MEAELGKTGVVVGEAVEGRRKGGDGKNQERKKQRRKRRSDTEKENGFRILIMT